MKSIAAFGVLALALSFCGLAERFTGGKFTASPSNSVVNSATNANPSESNIEFERPEPTAAQTAILEKGKEIAWNAQGIRWRVPQNWRKLSEDRLSFNWIGADNAVLLVNISPLQADFPADVSLKAWHDGAVTRKKNGEIESVRYLEIDGVKGVEFVETGADGETSARRYQWMAYRNYAGQLQLLNFMLSTNGANFEKHRDEFAAILFSTKIVN